MEAGVRNAADKDLGDRANKVFTQLMHLKKVIILLGLTFS